MTFLAPARPPRDSALRTLWVHNFDPSIPVGGIFMHTLADAVQACGVSVDMLCTGRLTSPVEIWRARSLLRELSGEFDLVHAQYGSMCSLVATAAQGPALLSLRGSDWYRLPEGTLSQRLHGNLANALTRRALPHFDRVIVMSEAMRRDIEAQRPRLVRGPVDVVTDGLDLEMFRPLDRQACRGKLGHGADRRPWVLMTTLFDDNPVKRVPLAKAAVALAKQALPDLVLKIASGVPYEDMPLWVNACNAILLTSEHEGWPNAIKEALACNVPFISTDVSDLATISAREPSCHTTAADPAALAAALLETLGHAPPQHLRQHVQAMEVRTVARRLCDIYREMLEQPCAA